MDDAIEPNRIVMDLRSPPADFFLLDTVTVARDLIGTYLVRDVDGERLAGRSVETEAYREEEPASHSYRGKTRRTEPMFEAGGVAYVYFIYGMYDCFNVVTERDGVGCAVLVRAVDPVLGVDLMWRNRFPSTRFDESKKHLIANGPGKLCRAFSISRKDSGGSLIDGSIRILIAADTPKPQIETSSRVGIKKATELPWRFFEKGNSSVGRGP